MLLCSVTEKTKHLPHQFTTGPDRDKAKWWGTGMHPHVPEMTVRLHVHILCSQQRASDMIHVLAWVFPLLLFFFLFYLSLPIYHHSEGPPPPVDPLNDPNAHPKSDLRSLYSMGPSMFLPVSVSVCVRFQTCQCVWMHWSWCVFSLFAHIFNYV